MTSVKSPFFGKTSSIANTFFTTKPKAKANSFFVTKQEVKANSFFTQKPDVQGQNPFFVKPEQIQNPFFTAKVTHTKTQDVVDQPLDDITNIITKDTTTTQKAAELVNYVTQGKALTAATYDWCKSWLIANRNTIYFAVGISSAIALAPILATSLASGSLASFLGFLVKMGWGSVPILLQGGGMLASSLAKAGITSISGIAVTKGATVTVSSLIYALKKTNAGRKVLERRVDNAALKRTFQRLGVDSANLKYETVSKEVAGIVASGLVSTYILGTSLPVFAVFTALGYGVRLATGASTKEQASVREVQIPPIPTRIPKTTPIKIAKRDAIQEATNIIQETAKMQEHIIQEVIDSPKTTILIEEIADQTSSVISNLETTNVYTKKEEIVLPELAVGDTKTKYGVGCALGAASVMTALAFTGNASGVAELVGGLSVDAVTSLMAGTSAVLATTQAKAFLLDAVFRKVGVTKAIEVCITGEEKQRALSIAEELKKVKEAGVIDSLKHKLLFMLVGGQSYYSLQDLEKLSNTELQKLSRQRITDRKQLINAIILQQSAAYTTFVKMVASGIAPVLTAAVASASVGVYETYTSQEFQDLFQIKENLYDARVKELQELTVKKNLELAHSQSTRIEAMKATQREARALEEIKKAADQVKESLKIAEEQAIRAQAFQQSIQKYIIQGKVDPETLQVLTTNLGNTELKAPELLKQVLQKEFQDIEFTPLMTAAMESAGVGMAVKGGMEGMIGWLPGVGWGIQAYSTAAEAAQKIQLATDVGEKVKQLIDKGVAEVAASGFEKTIASAFVGVQNLPTISTTAEYIKTALGTSTGKAKLYDALAGVLDNMAKSGELHQNNPQLMTNLYGRLANTLIYGSDVEGYKGEVGHAAVGVGKLLYQGIAAAMGK